MHAYNCAGVPKGGRRENDNGHTPRGRRTTPGPENPANRHRSQASAAKIVDRRGDEPPEVATEAASRLDKAVRAAEGQGYELIIVDTAPQADRAAARAARIANFEVAPLQPSIVDLDAVDVCKLQARRRRGTAAHMCAGIPTGSPKCGKSFLALDLAVAVVAGVSCLRRFAVGRPGCALLYPVEDAPHIVRRLEGICACQQPCPPPAQTLATVGLAFPASGSRDGKRELTDLMALGLRPHCGSGDCLGHVTRYRVGTLVSDRRKNSEQFSSFINPDLP
jgi:hypothetical protein